MRLIFGIILTFFFSCVLSQDQKELSYGGGLCDKDQSCNYPMGTCLNSTCVCELGYYEKDCTYKAKESLTAGLLGLLLIAGIPGVPSLYMGYIKWGVPQIVLGLIFGPAGTALVRSGQLWAIIFVLVYWAMWFWTLSDAIQFGIRNPGYDVDGNGYPSI